MRQSPPPHGRVSCQLRASSSDAALKDGEDDLTGLSVTNTEGAEISWKTATETVAEGREHHADSGYPPD